VIDPDKGERVAVKRFMKIAAVNIAVTVCLLLVINFLATAVVIAQKLRAPTKGAGDQRIEVAAVEDRARARTFFDEFYRLEARYVPYAEWRYEPFSGEAINIDENGNRRGTAAGAGGRRVLFFGGSTMWGTGVWDDETIPAFVEKEMEGVTAVNYGQSGFVSRQELNGLMSALNNGEAPGAVVFYDGVNDVYVLCTAASYANGHGQEAEMSEAVRRYTHRGVQILRDMFFEGVVELSQLVSAKFGLAAYSNSSQRSCATDSDLARRVADAIWTNWLAAKDLLARRGVPFLAVLQPVTGFGDPNISYLPDLERTSAEYRAVYPLIREKMAGQGNWTLDLSGALDGEEKYYIDWSHIVAPGNRLIAGHIGKRLAPMMGQEPVPAP
jgi:hypothetical protein